MLFSIFAIEFISRDTYSIAAEHMQGGAPSSYKLVVNPLTIDISPTKTIVIRVINQLSPSNYIVMSTINHSYWSYVHQLSYLGGTTLWGLKMGPQPCPLCPASRQHWRLGRSPALAPGEKRGDLEIPKVNWGLSLMGLRKTWENSL